METRPRTYPAAKAPLTTDQKVVALQRTTETQAATLVEHAAALTDHSTEIGTLTASVSTIAATVGGLPPTDTIWSDSRPDAGFGAGPEPTWTGTGDGTTTTFGIAGRISTAPARYVVLVGGIQQPPSAYSLPSGAETIVFATAPPADESVVVYAPFYGSAS